MKWEEVHRIFEDLIAQGKAQFPNLREAIYDRCIGIVSREELEKIRTTHIAVLGVGGIGMPLLELLVRAGAETLTIVDKDIIDPTNMNRVPFAFPFTFGQKKIEVAELFMRLINPNVKIRTFETVTSKNVAEVLQEVEVAALTMDGLYSSLVATHYCRHHDIPLIEGWSLAGILNARIFMPEGPSYEEVYKFEITKPYDDLTEEDLAALDDAMLVALSKICLLYTSPSPRDLSTSRMPSSA